MWQDTLKQKNHYRSSSEDLLIIQTLLKQFLQDKDTLGHFEIDIGEKENFPYIYILNQESQNQNQIHSMVEDKHHTNDYCRICKREEQ